MATEVDLAHFNPFDRATLQCPYPYYAAMRHDAPVHYAAAIDAYLVVDRDLVDEVVRDPVTYSSIFRSKYAKAAVALSPDALEQIAAVVAEGYPRVPTMISADPPAHTRYRRLVSKAFSVRAIGELEPVVREIAGRLIDRWIERGRVEFVEEFAVPLPMEVIARALNVPDDRLVDFKRWSGDIVAGVGANPSLARRLEAERGINEFQRYFADAIEQRRAHPQDDLLTRLLEARIDDEDHDVADTRRLDMAEMLSLVQQLLAGGNETTTKLLAEMIRMLGQRPEWWERLRSDASLVPAVIEESLRLASIAQGMWRLTTRDTELGGVHVPAGSRVIPVYAAVNHDEALFADPEAFDPTRTNLNEHLAFGKGTHFCLGANLARLEGRIALEELTRRIASIELGASNDYAYNASFLVRGLLELHLDIVEA